MSLSSTSSSSATTACPEAPAAERTVPHRTGAVDVTRGLAAPRRESAVPRRAPTLSLRGYRPWGALCAMVMVASAEIGARVLLPDVPAEGIYGSYPIQQKIAGLERTLRERPVDVLFIGSSIVDHGIDPQRFDRLCLERGIQVTSYNLGIRGPSMAGIGAILNRFFLPRLKPRLAYICLSPNALNRNRTPYVADVTRRFEKTARMSRLEEFFRRGLSRLHLYAYRQDLYAWLTGGGKNGFSRRKRAERRGFSPRHGVMNGEDNWFGRLGNFDPEPRDVEALTALCRWCTSTGADCEIVDMPLAPHCRALPTDEQRESYAAVLSQVGAPGVTVLSLSPEDFTPRHFNDGMHLNVEGAERLTALLALDAARRLTPRAAGDQ